MYCLNSGLAAKLIGLNIIVFVTETFCSKQPLVGIITLAIMCIRDEW